MNSMKYEEPSLFIVITSSASTYVETSFERVALGTSMDTKKFALCCEDGTIIMTVFFVSVFSLRFDGSNHKLRIHGETGLVELA